MPQPAGANQPHVCLSAKPDGQACGKQFARLWNLQRHIHTQHGVTAATPPTPAQCRPALPSYETSTSKKTPGQQRAVCWLTAAAKGDFDDHLADIYRRWGVGPGVGTCLIWPRDWTALQPQAVVQRLTATNCPADDDEAAIYQYVDHQTRLARAAAWFTRWPRSGIQLDNFLECGPFQRVDASHLCHASLCVNRHHLVLEPCAVNQDRRQCHSEALGLRRRGRSVPPACREHDPPCLLQHAALTVLERCAIQSWILALSSPAARVGPPPRPVDHGFPTFETRLPLLFAGGGSALVLPERDIARPPPPALCPKPSLVCLFCTRIRAFHGVVALWSHLVHQHPGEDEEPKLRLVRETAAAWQEHLARRRQPASDATAEMLAQARSADFS